MKTKSFACSFVALVLSSVVSAPLPSAFAQGTAFTYQGRLNDGGNPASGIYDLRFAIYDAVTNGNAVGNSLTNSATAISNGLFIVTLDFGGIFTGSNYWLDIGVRTNGGAAFAALNPRQPLTPVPYAVFAAGANAAGISGTVPSAGLGGSYSNAVNFYNGANSFNGTFYGAFYGISFIGGSFDGNFIGSGSGLGDVWHTGGNSGTMAGANFLGTMDNQPLELRANGQRALRLEPNNVYGAPNVIGGASGNVVSNGVFGATIAGGGANSFVGATPNRVAAIFGTISGGRNNYVGADHASVGGGHDNSIGVLSYDSVIAGGASDTIQTNAVGSVIGGGYGNAIQANSSLAFIGGGNGNKIAGYDSAIGGGEQNFIQYPADHSVIGGGGFNTVAGSISQPVYAVIAGGGNNLIQTNSSYSAIGGGNANTVGVGAQGAFIGGGSYNYVAASQGAIYGGGFNQIGVGATYSVIAGGSRQMIQSNAVGSAIVGGEQNSIVSSFGWDSIGGGAGNNIASFASVIGGGVVNIIQSNADDATISGGLSNIVGTNAAFATIPGGFSNSVAGSYALAAGQRAKANHNGTFVWADSQNADFASAATNQFLIRAGGGVGIGTATTPPGGLRVHSGGLGVTGASSPNYGTNAGVYIEWNATQGNVYAFDYNPSLFVGKPLILNGPGGPVGVGRLPTANTLEVEGDASKTVAGSWLANSDARIKQDIHPVSGALATLERVHLVSFRYTKDYRREHPSVGDRRYLNVVAQEFREVFPDDVKSSGEKLPDGSDDILQVDTYPLTIYSAAAIQELDTELKQKETEITELKARLEKLERLVNQKNGGAQ